MGNMGGFTTLHKERNSQKVKLYVLNEAMIDA